MKTAVVCGDETRRTFLAEVVRRHAPMGTVLAVLEFASAGAAATAIGSSSEFPFVMFSLVGGGVPETDMPVLKQAFPRSRIIVELDDDDVERAFEMLCLGAFNVVSYLITRTELLWDLSIKAIGNRPPYEPLVVPASGPHPWGFMSMPYDLDSPAQGDYSFAIAPTMKRLGLDLRRMDEMPYEGVPNLQEQAKTAIKDCQVFFTLISYLTENCSIEAGFALGQGKTIILLWRRDLGKMPELLKGIRYIEYSTMTELAMRLFFGLGGMLAHLDAYAR